MRMNPHLIKYLVVAWIMVPCLSEEDAKYRIVSLILTAASYLTYRFGPEFPLIRGLAIRSFYGYLSITFVWIFGHLFVKEVMKTSGLSDAIYYFVLSYMLLIMLDLKPPSEKKRGRGISKLGKALMDKINIQHPPPLPTRT